MRVQVGNTVWDQHVGAVTPATTAVRVDQRDDGSVRLHGSAEIDQARGQLVTTRIVADETAAIVLSARATALIDTRTAIALPGVIFASVRIDGVEIKRQAVRRNGREILVTATWTLGQRSQSDEDPRELYVPCRVETASVWGDWTERPDLVVTAAVEVWGPSPGSASFLQIVDTKSITAAPLPITGHYVRFWIPTGADLARPEGWVLHWWGRIKTRDLGDSNGRLTCVFQALDLTDDFDTFLHRWYERTAAGGVTDPGEVLPMNKLPGGDRSTGGIGPGGTFVAERHSLPSVPWRASQAVDLLLAALRDQYPGGADWEVIGQTTALGYLAPAELDGRSVREQLAQFVARGLGWISGVNPDTGKAYIDIRSPLLGAIAAGDWTCPANDRVVTVDLPAMTDLVGWSLGEDLMRVADRVNIRVANPWHAISLGINGDDDLQLRKDYTGGEVTTWDSATEDTRNTTLAHVHRRFRLASDWVGGNYETPAYVLPLGRTVATDALHGTDGEIGAWEAGGDGFVARAIRFTKVLPFTGGARDWTTPESEELDPSEPLERAFVCVVEDPGGLGESWTYLDMEVTIDDNAPVVVIGRDAADAETIRDLLADGKHLVVTLGYRYPLPWRVSWRRAPEDRLVDRERGVEYHRPDIEWRYMEAGTVVGIEGNAPRIATGGTIGDKPETPLHLLLAARLVHELPAIDLTWTRSNVLDVSTATRQGSLIAEATLPYGDPNGDPNPYTTVPTATIITARGWNFDRQRPGTTVSAARRIIDALVTPEPEPIPPGATAIDLAALTYPGGG